MKKVIIFITACVIMLLMALTLIGNFQTGISLLSGFGVFLYFSLVIFILKKTAWVRKR